MSSTGRAYGRSRGIFADMDGDVEPAVRRRMESQRRRDTLPELALRQALHAAGYRYRVNFKVPGSSRRTMDIAFTRQRIAVFVDGCFWHGCPQHFTVPKTRPDFWTTKIAGNRQRDQETTQMLAAAGWAVVRYWEHQTSSAMFADLAGRLRRHQSAGELADRSLR